MRSETFVCRHVKRGIIGVQFTPTMVSGFMEIHSEVLEERRWANVAKQACIWDFKLYKRHKPNRLKRGVLQI